MRDNSGTNNEQVNLYLSKRGFRNDRDVQVDLLLYFAKELHLKQLRVEKHSRWNFAIVVYYLQARFKCRKKDLLFMDLMGSAPV